MLLYGGTGHSNNCQIIRKFFVYDICCNNFQDKKFQANLEVSQVLITFVTNIGEAKVKLHLEAGHRNNCQIILILFGCDIFCNNLQNRNNFKQIWRYHIYKLLTFQTGGRLGQCYR